MPMNEEMNDDSGGDDKVVARLSAGATLRKL